MEEKIFTVFWLTGKSQIIKGYDAVSAFNNSGIGAGALRACDFYAEGNKQNEWVWNKERHTWEKTAPLMGDVGKVK